MPLRFVPTFVILLALGCTPKGEPGSCFRDKDNACVEYGPDQAVGGKRLCAGYTWLAGACPKEGRVGACVKDGAKTVEYVYSGAPNRFTPEAAKAACGTAGGAFRE